MVENVEIKKEIKTSSTTSKEYETKKTIFKTYQVVWYIVGIIEVLLGFRFLFKALAANPNSPFVDMVYGLSRPFVFPFLGIFRSPSGEGYIVEAATLVALIVYPILGYLLTEFLALVKPPSPEEVE